MTSNEAVPGPELPSSSLTDSPAMLRPNLPTRTDQRNSSGPQNDSCIGSAASPPSALTSGSLPLAPPPPAELSEKMSDTSAASSDMTAGAGAGAGTGGGSGRPVRGARFGMSRPLCSHRPLSSLSGLRRRASLLASQTLVNGLGLRPGKDVWGLEDYDMGLCATKVEWYEEAEPHEMHKMPTWWDTPWKRVPDVRHLWGEPQYELHPGPQELFLDLIFVGVAYRIGTVLKVAFYSCDHPGRRLAEGDYGVECIGLGLGALHSLAPFMCMYLLWQSARPPPTPARAQHLHHRPLYAVHTCAAASAV